MQMPSDFANIVEFLTDSNAERIRSAYIETFIDTTSDWYRDSIERTVQGSYGRWYTGFLWECAKNARIVSESDAGSFFDRDTIVFVMWDLKPPVSPEIAELMKDYWEIPHNSIMVVSYGSFIKYMEFLHPDMYVFDESLEWSVMFTHETDPDNHPLCLIAQATTMRTAT